MSELSRKMFLAETAAVREYLAEQEQQATAEAAPRPALDRATAVEPPATPPADGIRDQLLHAIDHAYTTGVLGYGTPEELLAAYDTSRTPQDADRAALRDRIADALADAEGWQWAPGFNKSQSPTYQGYLRQGDAVLAVLPEPADRAAVLRWAAEELDARMERFFSEWPDEPRNSPYALGQKDAAAELRRMADETATTQTPGKSCAHCGQPISRVIGTRAAWWIHAPGGNTVCDPQHAASSTRATPKQPPMDPVHILGIKAADETATTEPDPACAHCGGDHVWDNCEAYTKLVADDEPAAGARQDEPTALGLLPLLTSPEPCRWDGPVCTTHSWRSDIGRCPHAQAQALLGGVPR